MLQGSVIVGLLTNNMTLCTLNKHTAKTTENLLYVYFIVSGKPGIPLQKIHQTLKVTVAQ